MGRRSDTFELGALGLLSGEARTLDLDVGLEALEFGGERYEPRPSTAPARLEVSRTARGYVVRLRYVVALAGRCARCLEEADRRVEVDAREVDQPGGGEELSSPYLDGNELDLHSWARDSLVLALPVQIVCRDDCRGLCATCGENLNEAGGDHEHERPADPRWAKLKELELE